MNALVSLKTKNDDFEVIYEVLPPWSTATTIDSRKTELDMALQDIDQQLLACERKVNELNAKHEKYTNSGDNLDYVLAASCGVLTGLIDSLMGAELQKYADGVVNNTVLNSAKEEKIRESIKKAESKAAEKGLKLTSEQRDSIRQSVEKQFTPKANESGVISDEESKRVLSKAILYLENHKKSPTDSVWRYKGSTITPESHHIDDFSHHASIVGLAASILTQFTKHGYFSDKNGSYIPLEIDPKSGDLIGKTVPQKIACGFANWFWHLMSDVAGTSGKNAGEGMGIPGPIMSFAKEVASLPGLNRTGLAETINGIFAEGVDFRTEISQSIPVMINDVLVRICYSTRRFVIEYRKKETLKDLAWRKILPFGNRTIARMLTIATGAFSTVDMIDAAVRAAPQSGGTLVGFVGAFVLHVNFAGVSRFAIAVTVDAKMGLRKAGLERRTMKAMEQQLYLMNAKVFYKYAELNILEEELFDTQTEMWITAESTIRTLSEAYEVAQESVVSCQNYIQEIYSTLERARSNGVYEKFRTQHAETSQDLVNILRWGEK